AEQRQNELDPHRHEEAVLRVKNYDRAEHIARQAERRESSRKADDESGTTEKLDDAEERTRDHRQRRAHVRERGTDSGRAEDEQLLPSVGDEYHADDGPQDEQRGIYVLRRLATTVHVDILAEG